MAEQDQNEQAPGTKKPEGQERPSGVKLLRTLKAQKGEIFSVAFDPLGEMLASAAVDYTVTLWDAASGELLRTLESDGGVVFHVAFDPSGRVLATGSNSDKIRLWDTTSGKRLRTLEGHQNSVGSVAFNPSGRTLASGGYDHVIKLWDATSGKLRRTLKGHKDWVRTITFHPSEPMLASCSDDGTIKLWDVSSGELLRTWQGHENLVVGISYDPSGRMLASGSSDKTVKLWDALSGQLLRTLEGHTERVNGVAWSPDGRILASQSTDQTIRLWRCDTWDFIASIKTVTPGLTGALAFHPNLPILAAPSRTENDIDLWELDYEVLLGSGSGFTAPSKAVHHTTARIVLVGDSGVGKTGLGWRLAHGEFKEHASTHGQQFWVMPELGKLRDDGTECEAILWDLAGQPDYRLTHALFLDDADLALVLFDPTDTRDPLHGVEFWLKQLGSDSPGAGTMKCRIVLVAARADRGGATLTEGQLEEFCRQRGLSGYFRTSAKGGEGLVELIERMKQLIPWDDKPATVTTKTFKRVKDFVLGLKEKTDGQAMVVTWEDLRQQLAQTDAAWEFTDAEMTTAVSHLENYGYVRRLRTSKGEERVLLKPELLNNLAASFVFEARRNPKGLGALEEKRLLAGGYPFPELEKLSPAERDLLIDAATLLFLKKHVCFREQTLDEQAYLIFPELINLKMPAVEEKEPIVDGAAYTVSGAVENVYASLVVLLGYTQTFTRTAQWKDQARYEVGGGAVCGFRQEAERDGELDFVLYFCVSVRAATRRLFQGLFESFLERRNLTVTRFEPVVCANGHPLNRAVVREQLGRRAEFAFCPICGSKMALPSAHEPIQLTREQRVEVEAQRRVADRRTRFEQAIFRVQTYVKDQKISAPGCFISYAWGVAEQERWVEKQLATDLQKAGLGVVLDRWHNSQTGASVSRFIERIEKSDRIVVVGTPLYRRKYDNKETAVGYVVAAEVELINTRLIGTEAQKESVLPLLRAGEKTTSLPPLLHGRVYADFRQEETYFATCFDLILDLYQIPHQDPAVADLRESLLGDVDG